MDVQYYEGFEFITADELHKQFAEKYNVPLQIIIEFSEIYINEEYGFKYMVTIAMLFGDTDLTNKKHKLKRKVSNSKQLKKTQEFINKFELQDKPFKH